MRKIILSALGLVVAATVAGCKDDGDDIFAQCRQTTVGTGVASIGGPFELVDQTGKTVTSAELMTKPSFVYFGYSYCPDVCPVDNARNAEALDRLIAEGHDPQLIFISVDPERDTPERMAEFAEFIHPEMVGLTGPMDKIQEAVRGYKAYFRKEEGGDPDFYLIDHSTFTYLMLPEIGFVDFFKRDDSPEEIAQRTSCFLDVAAQVNK